MFDPTISYDPAQSEKNREYRNTAMTTTTI